MSKLKAFGLFWYDFIIGDDWHVAALVAAGLAVTALAVHVAGVNAWWLLPLCVFAALAWSLHRATSRKPLRVTAQGQAAGAIAFRLTGDDVIAVGRGVLQRRGVAVGLDEPGQPAGAVAG